MPRQIPFTAFLLAASVLMPAQTTIDLSTQSRNIDFSRAVSTRAFKTGNSLPPICSVGETFFLSDAPPGRNFFGCVAPNIWFEQGHSDGVVGSAADAGFAYQPAAAQRLTITSGSFRFAGSVTSIDQGEITIAGTSSGAIWVYAVQSASIVVAHNLGPASVSVTGAGYVQDEAGNGFPLNSIPLFECSVTSGQPSCTDRRAILSSEVVTAGPSGSLSVNCSPGNPCTVDTVPSVVPTLTGANMFSGLNVFEHLQAPAGSTPASADCDEASEAGKLQVDTTAPAGQQLFVCEGTNGWRRQSDSAASGLPDTGSDGLVKRTGPNQTAAAIEGVDYYKPGGTPVAASDLPDVATLTGSNTFTGSNVFTNLKVPSGSSLETAQCDEASEAGRVYVNTTAPAGQQLFVCEGINGWRLQSAPAAPSGLADTGSNGLVKRTGPNQTAAAVEGVDYYKPGGAPISASDLPGIPRLASSNTFTGLNIFAQLKAPSGSSPDAAQCNEVSEAGKLYVNTAAPTGQQLFVCEGINGWRLQSAPAAPSGLADTGSNGLVKRTGPNQTAAAVEGVDYYKPGGTPISASDLPGIPRLASSNTFTGLNIFAQLQAPSGLSPDAAQCNEVFEAGKLYVNTAAAVGQQLFVCEGINGWRQQSAPGASSGLPDTGSNGLVKRTASNQTAAAVEGVDYYKPGGTAISASDLPNPSSGGVGYMSSVALGPTLMSVPSIASANEVRAILVAVPFKMTIARLAAWTVTIAPGGIGRVGVYKPIGPNQAILVTQSGPLDAASNNAWRDSLVTPQTIEPGFYYFAWSLNNTTSRFAGLAGGTYHGIFNRNSRYPTTASCTERMNDTDGLPSNCTLSTENGISLIAVLAFAD